MSPDNVFSLVDRIARKEQELDTLRRQLFQHQAGATYTSGDITVLRCQLHGHAVALPVDEILEVVRMVELTVLPDAFPWVIGLMSIASKRIPVIDLFGAVAGRRRLAEPDDFIVIAETRNGTIGLVMDEIDGLFRLEGGALSRPEPDLPFGAHVRGVFDAAGHSVLLLSAAPISIAELALKAST